MPSSRLTRRASSESESLTGPQADPIGQVPNPISEAFHPVRPNGRWRNKVSSRKLGCSSRPLAHRRKVIMPPDDTATYSNARCCQDRQCPSSAIPRFRDRVGSYPLLALECRSWAVWPWTCFHPCPAPKSRDRRAAIARATGGTLRRTLVARPALAVAISAPSLLTKLDKAVLNSESRYP